MTEKTREILNDKRLTEYHNKWFDEMYSVYRGERKEPFYLNGVYGSAPDPDIIYTEPEKWVEQSLEDLANKAYDVISEERFVPLCIQQDIYGVHFIDKIFGAEVVRKTGGWNSFYLKTPIGELKRPDLETNETWLIAKRVAKAFVDLDVSVPFFGLPTIASVLNIAVNLYGQDILIAMIEDPDAARHDLKIINDLLKEIHQWYRAHIPEEQLQPIIAGHRTQPPGHGQICGCTCQLLSPELYEEFIMELDNELLGVYPNGGMIHLCGSHSQLIPHFRNMDKLKSLQVNDRAAEDLELYFDGLREDQVIYFNQCNGITKEKAWQIANEKNRRIILV